MLFVIAFSMFLGIKPGAPAVVAEVCAAEAPYAVPAAFGKTDQGVFLLFEDFEGQTLPGWDLDDNTPGLPGWQHVFRSDAFSGVGYLEITGFDSEGFCIPKTKELMTPSISTIGLSEITVSIQARSFNEQITQKRNKFMPNLRLSGISTDLAGKTERVFFSSVRPQIQAMEDGWELFSFTIPGTQVPPGTFNFTVTYTSTPDSCEILQLDDFQVLGLISGDAPDTMIVEPPRLGGPRVVQVGEPVRFRATTPDGAAGFAFEWLIVDPETQQVFLATQGEEVTITIFETGAFLVLCSAVDGLGRRDPTPDSYLLLVVPDRDLDTIIVEPEETTLDVGRGSQITFRAAMVGGNRQNIQFDWAVIGGDANRQIREFRGETIVVPFNSEGRFTVLCQATDGVGFRDPSPATREVRVFGTHVKIVQPSDALRQKEIAVPIGSTVDFRGILLNPEGAINNVFWQRNPGLQDQVCVGSTDCSLAFNQPGFFSVSFVGEGADGPVASDFIRVVVDPPLYLQLLVPELIEIQVGDPLVLEGNVLGTLSQNAQVFWVFKGQVYPGSRAEIENLNERGQYQAKMVARLPGQNESLSRTIRVDVEDPDAPVAPVITSPRTDLTIPPGESVFFDSSLRKVPRSRRNPYWEIRDRESGSLLKSGHTGTLGRVQFNSGLYDVSLFLRSDQGDQLVDEREIMVAQLTSDSFGDNSSLDSAAEIDAGAWPLPYLYAWLADAGEIPLLLALGRLGEPADRGRAGGRLQVRAGSRRRPRSAARGYPRKAGESHLALPQR